MAVTDGPPAMSWDMYSEHVSREWSNLLSEKKNREPELHEFLEMHPCLVPGYDAFHASVDPGPVYATLFTKPVLPGYRKRVPDFMWLPTDSVNQWIVLVEIEDQNKEWLTSSGQQRAPLTQAVNQVQEWRAHLSEPSNMQQFMNLYGLPPDRPNDVEFCLVYGRRSEAIRSERRPGLRQAYQPRDVTWMSYDRLRPAEAMRDCLCSKVVDAARFEAVSVPATLRITPNLASMWRSIQGKGEAALRSPYLSDARRRFLYERFRYWDEFTAADKRSLYGLEQE